MVKTFYYLLKEARARQWIKNLIVFAPIFVTGKLLDPILFTQTLVAFIALCAASSSVYIINDLEDLTKDRLHPFKRNRPLASGKISRTTALTTVIIFLTITVGVSLTVGIPFLGIVLAFLVLQFSYTFVLKNIMLIDVLTIAASFILRVIAGETATGYHINIWLFYTIVSAALFLAVGKRRSELTLLSGWEGGIPAKTRATLSHYSEKMLDVYISMFANSTWLTYAFYAFLERPPVLRNTIGSFFISNDIGFLGERKWLMLTIPFVIYGIMRYLQLIYERNIGESPETVILTDKPLIADAAILGALLFAIFYVIGK